MQLLPPPGPQRTRLALLTVALGLAVAYVIYTQYGPGAVPVAPTTPANAPASNTSGLLAQATTPVKPAASSAQASMTPEPLRLPDLERVPDEPAAGRNPFRFGAPPPPPPPPTPVYTPPPTPTLPPLPPPPMVPLRLAGVVVLQPHAKNRAFLADQTGALFEAIEGQIVDGRYRVVAVGSSQAVVEFLNGTGRRTLQVGGRIGG